MYLLGLDIGTSFVKASVVDAQSKQCVASATYPDNETEIIALQPNWAEQNPNTWWQNAICAIQKCNSSDKYNPSDITAVGIAYQMHGLVMVDKDYQPIRNSIIWCDSRAVEIGEKAFAAIGKQKCLTHLLNSPANFTASKLAWVKQHEPANFEKIYKVMLPGDFIAAKFTGEATTTPSALSEGILWDFKQHSIAADVLQYFGFSDNIFSNIANVFSNHGYIKDDIAKLCGFKKGVPITYKAGDQLNNAFSLNVMNAGDVAATAGTSGVIYAVDNAFRCDELSRINSFAHVNHTHENCSVGHLLCINGTGIFNRWIKQLLGNHFTYHQLNEMAADNAVGSDGFIALPFGNGAERMLQNKIVGAGFGNINFNVHSTAQMVRAVQEGIACAFNFGLDIMKLNGIHPTVIKAGKANMFLSNVFSETVAALTQVPIELYENDGSIGAAIAAGLGAGYYANANEANSHLKKYQTIEPSADTNYETLYNNWANYLNKIIA